MPAHQTTTSDQEERRALEPRSWSSSAPNGLDSIDRQIISHLQRDGRRAYGAIADEVGLSEAGVRRRVQRLKDSASCRSSRSPIRSNSATAVKRSSAFACTATFDWWPTRSPSIDEANYVVMTAGSFDIIAEVIAVDDDALRAPLE